MPKNYIQFTIVYSGKKYRLKNCWGESWFLDKHKFAKCLYGHLQDMLDLLQENHISIDGKVLRATAKRGR